jgi:hypothetical protein
MKKAGIAMAGFDTWNIIDRLDPPVRSAIAVIIETRRANRILAHAE